MASKKAGKKSSSKKTKSSSPVFSVPQYNLGKAAAEEVDWANDPALEEIAAQQNALKDQYQEHNQAMGQIQQGTLNELNKSTLGTNYGDIMGNLNTQLQDFGGNLDQFGIGQGEWGQGRDEEGAAAVGQYGAIGQGALTALAGNQARDVAYRGNIRNQAVMDMANRKANLLESYRDGIAALQEGRMNIFEDVPEQRSRTKRQFQDSRFDQGLQLGQFELNEKQLKQQDKANKWLIDYLQGRLDSRGNRNRGGGGGKGGGKKPKAGEDGWSGPGDVAGPGAKPPERKIGKKPPKQDASYYGQLKEDYHGSVRFRGEKLYGPGVKFTKENGEWYAITGAISTYGPNQKVKVTDKDLLHALQGRRKAKKSQKKANKTNKKAGKKKSKGTNSGYTSGP